MQDTATLAGLNFELSEEQIAARDAARDFAQNVLKPGVIDRDREQLAGFLHRRLELR